ncbi:MAG: FG-GAP-like repeat-containing protein [Fimbriiglobus sp.]
MAGYIRTDLGGTTGGVSVQDGFATLTEGDRFRVGLSKAFTIPATPTAVVVSFDAPIFDGRSQGLVKDAFEIAVLGADGSPLALPTMTGRDAAFNWTEGFDALGGPATSVNKTAAMVTLTGIPAGTAAQLVMRLVNNDSDTTTSVRLRRVDFVAATGSVPTGVETAGMRTASAVDLAPLSDVTPSIEPVYGRTTLTEENTLLSVDLGLKNIGGYPVVGNAVLAISNLSDPNVAVMNPDGFTADGRPYVDLSRELGAGLMPGATTASRLVQFTNPNRERFTYDVQVLAGLNSAPRFGTLADAEATVGQTFAVNAEATDTDALTYRLLAGPAGMTIDGTGRILFTPIADNVGTHVVRVRVTDAFGAIAEGTFTLTVRTGQPNRPPLFTSTPPTDATVASPFEVQTYATGPNLVALTAGNFGTGVSIITADPSDQTLRLHSGSNFKAAPLSVGELNPTLFDNHPLLRGAAVNLGFAPGTEYNSEREVYGIVADDVNRDGNPDLIASVVLNATRFQEATTGEGYLAVRLGNGDGTFRTGWQVKLPTVKIGTTTYAPVVDTLRHVDVTGDSIKDLVTVQKYGGRMLVYPGRGDGTFVDAPVVTESEAHINNFQVADLNADGKQDLVRFEKKYSGKFRSGTSVLFGNGAGGFEGEVLLTALDRETDGYLVDLDGKNGPDIVRLDPLSGVGTASMNVRLNDGSGAFGSIISVVVGSPNSAQFGDFNSDGKIDAIVSTGVTGTAIGLSLLRGQGDGTFAVASDLPTIADVAAVSRGGDGVARDLNGDGKVDYLFGDISAAAVYVGLSDGTGGFDQNTYTARTSSDVGLDVTANEADTPFVATADFNRDGVMDVVFARKRESHVAGAIGIALGDRPGTLRLPRSQEISVWDSSETKLADFTGDGFPDLLSLNRFDITININRGDGTFEGPRVALNTQNNQISNTSLIFADFDDDGKNDLGYIDQQRTRFVQAFGNGDGTFTKMPVVTYPANVVFPGVLADFVQVGDFNADGHPDLAYRFRSGSAAGDSPYRQVFVLIYDPTARRFNQLPDATKLFTDAALYTLTSFPDEALGFADLNGDGKKELFTHALAVEANSSRPAQPTRLTVWQPTGGATTDAATLFTRTVFENPGFGNVDAENFVVGDFNRDGRPDLAIGANNGSIRVGFGTGDFRFRDVVVYNAPGLTALDSGDVNGDGNLDLIAILGGSRRNDGFANAGVYLGQPDGRFGPIQEFSGIGTDLTRTFRDKLSVADVNGDGRADFAINLIDEYFGVYTAAPAGLAAVARGDLNGDGKQDLVALNTGFDRVKLLYGKGANQFDRQADLFSGLNPVALALGDTNGDSKLDILTANRGSKSVTLLRNTGSSFTRTDTKLVMRPDHIVTGELTGDGQADVIVVGESTLVVLPGNAGPLTAAFTLPLGFDVSGVTLADVSGDGKLDALLTDSTGKRVMILPGQGNGTFGAPTVVPLAARPGQVAATDLNADGKLDLVVTFPDQGRIGILFGRGNTRFTTPQLVTVGKTPATLQVQDVNTDGKPDLLVSNTGDGTLSVVLNRFDPSNLFRYQAKATDPDGDVVRFSLEDGPGGMLLDEATGMAVWAPMPEQIGANRVVLRASDGRGAYAEQGFNVRVTAPVAVAAPQFTSEPVDGVSADAVYRYQPRVTVPTTDPLRYTLVDGPAGMTVNPTTGEVTWDGRRNGLSLGIFRPNLSPPRFANRGEISIPDSPSLRSPSVTAETWFRADAMPGPTNLVTLIAKRWIPDNNPNNRQSWALEVRGGRFIAFTGNRSATPDAMVTAPTDFVANRWYHVALTFDDATRRLTLYVDGQAVGSAVSAVPLAYSDRPLEISPTNIFAGTLSGVRVWDQARSATAILADMTREVPPQSSGLVLDLRFNEQSNASTVEDSSPFDNSGSISTSDERYDYPERIPTLANAGDYPVALRVDDGRGGVSEQRFTVRVTSPFAVNVSGRVTDEAGAPLAGRTVYVDTNSNGRLTAGEPTTTTDTNGNYTFRLAGRSARISLAPEAGRIPTTPSQLVDLSTNATGINFSTRTTIAGPPVILSTGPTNFNAPGRFEYRVFASSTDGSVLSYRLSVAPDGAVIDPSSGFVSWNAGVNDSGVNEFILAVTDGQGRVTLQQFTLNVTVNTSPVVTSLAPTSAMVGVKLRYDVIAQDAEQTAFNYALEAAPAGMTIDASTGRIEWTPTATDLGTQSATIVVRDGVGGETRQSLSLVVGPETANNAPSFTTSPRLTAQVASPYRARLVATDTDGDALQFSLLDGPNGMTVSDGGELLWTRPEFGNATFRVQVRDGRGGVDEETYTLNVGTFASSTTLAITSSPPANGVLDLPYAHDLVAPGAVGFQLLDGPRGLSLDTLRGHIRWTPTLGQLGPVTVSVMAMDDLGTTTTLTWTITVRGSALAPAFASTPLTSIAVGETYVYPARANNEGGSPLVFSLVSGPAGMSIDGVTGDVTWTPNGSQLGTQAVILRVSDGLGNFSTQAFEIVVSAGSTNRPPVANTTPPTDASIGQALNYTFMATDPEGGVLTYSVARGPAGMTIDAATGRVTWTPAEADLGTVFVTLVARDAGGAAAVQSFAIDVRTPNRAPTITNMPPATVPQGGLFRYDILATDPDREPLFFDLLSGPAGMTVDALGRVRWQTATSTPLGNVPISVRVRDGRGSEETRNFNLGVVADTTAPRIAILIQPTLLFPYSPPARVRITVTDDVGVTGIRVLLDGVPVGLDANNSFTVPYTAPGNGRIEVFAVDAAGNEGRALNRISMRTGLENDPNNAPGEPTAVLDVVEGATVGGFVRIRGTATSPDFERYTLSYRRQDQASFTTIATGTTAVNNGELGVWDTTLLENDGYTLRLVVTDLFGGIATVERTVGVSGELKLGNFRLSFADMTIPVAGIPITIARTYDSLRADREGDFGYGWRMEFRNTDLRTSLPKSGLEDIGIYTPFRQGVRVFLTLPGGKREGFTFTPTIRVLPGFGGQGLAVATPAFTPDRGVRSTLSAGSGNLIVNEYGEMTAGGLPWNPASPNFSGYTLTTEDDVRYTINGAGELTSARDLNGNTITFSEAGVSGPGGTTVTFERDARGRVTAVRDPLGNAVRYAYSAAGDLSAVTDREGHTTTFGYRTDRPHYLETVTDPLGRTGVRTEYDANGRLVGAIDADGDRSTLSYDPNNQLVTSRDGLNRPTTIEYDQQGNVVASTDALGHTMRMTYNAAGDLLTVTDQLGRTTTMTYDARGNTTSITDPLGHVTRMTYDAGNRVLSMVDPLGRTTTNQYDARGNLIRMTDAAGGVTTHAVSDRGEILSVTDPLGRTSRFSYNVRGHLTETTTAEGQKTTYFLDSNGNATRFTLTPLGGGSAETTTMGYDRNGNMTGMTGADGESISMEYDAAGQVNRTTNTAGGRTIVSYTDDARQSGAIQPGGGAVNLGFDAAGQEVQAELPGGQQVRYEYDAVGRRVATILPNGTRLDTIYDAAGQQTGNSASGGTSSRREYDAAGRLIRRTNPDGVTIRNEFDALGRKTAQIDAAGNRTTFGYDSLDRLTETVLPTGQVLRTEYDAAGNLTRRTDASGGLWTYTYTDNNLLLAAIDPLGNTYTFLRNGHGRETGVTDPLGRTTTFSYDGAGRALSSSTPLGFTSTFGYDADGRRSLVTDPLGRTYTSTFDADGNPTSFTTPDGRYVTVYDVSGRPVEVTSPQGTSRINYDAVGIVTSRTDEDGTVVNYTMAANSRPTSVGTTFGVTTRDISDGDRLRSVIDPSGGVTTTSYDIVGRPTRVTYPGGLTADEIFDSVGRTLSIVYTGTDGGWGAAYTRNLNGQITAIDEDGRRIEYAYDVGGRLTRETRIVAGQSTVTEYGYDAAGNLTEIRNASGNRSFVVDADDRLLSDGTWTYTHDAAGRMTSRSRPGQTDRFFYDAFDRLIRVERSGTITTTVTYKYHADGLLAERREGATVVKFVWDRGTSLPQLLEERDGNGALIRRYESDGSRVTRYRDAAGNLFVYALDQVDSVRALMTPDGAVVTEYRYDAYGRPLAATPSGMGFGGGWYDPATDMLFLRSRWYQPEAARFITRDGAAPDPVDPTRTMNRYNYAANDPVNRVDPTGQTNISEIAMFFLVFNTLVFLSMFGLSYQAQSASKAGGLRQSLASSLENWWFTGISAFGQLGVEFNGGIFSSSFNIGGEIFLNTASEQVGIYAYFGPTISLGPKKFETGSKTVFRKPGLGPTGDASVNLVFDTPDVHAYAGWFWNVKAPIGFYVASYYLIRGKVPSLPIGVGGAVGSVGTLAFAWSPTVTFNGKGGGLGSNPKTKGKNLPNRHSHTVNLKPDWAISGISVGITYYFYLTHKDF